MNEKKNYIWNKERNALTTKTNCGLDSFFVLKQSKMQMNISIELEMKTQAERKENKTNWKKANRIAAYE